MHPKWLSISETRCERGGILLDNLCKTPPLRTKNKNNPHFLRLKFAYMPKVLYFCSCFENEYGLCIFMKQKIGLLFRGTLR